MKTYTEQELLSAIQYACEYQKACDYQTAGQHLIVDNIYLQVNIVKLLDELCDTDNSSYKEIQLSDIFK